MNKILIVAVAAAMLAACDNSDHTIVARGPGDPNAAEVNTVGVVLPPSIAASKIYRCKDNDVVYIDWLSDNASANFRAAQGDTPTHLTAAVPGDPLIAEGYSLKGTASDVSITLTRPGKGSQTCKS